MTFEKYTEEIIKETKEPVVIEYKKDDLLKRKESLLRDLANVQDLIDDVDSMLNLFK